MGIFSSNSSICDNCKHLHKEHTKINSNTPRINCSPRSKNNNFCTKCYHVSHTSNHCNEVLKEEYYPGSDLASANFAGCSMGIVAIPTYNNSSIIKYCSCKHDSSNRDNDIVCDKKCTSCQCNKCKKIPKNNFCKN